MNSLKTIGLFLLPFLFTPFLFSQPIFINEFMASNKETIADENGEFDDWVEIYNAGNSAYNLGGKFITDDLTNPNKWQIPTTNSDLTTILPNDYLIIWFDGDTNQGVLHINAKLSSDGEQIGIYEEDGRTLIDTLSFFVQTKDVSEGRFPDGSIIFTNFSTPSPMETNGMPSLEVVEMPNMSFQGGLYNVPIFLTISALTSEAIIYYTTDGSDPNESSLMYNDSIIINDSKVIRAIAYKEGMTPSEINTQSYLINTSHSFPIVSISGSPDKFFGTEAGLFPNYQQDIEVPLNIEFYETDGRLGFNQLMEVEIHGSASAILPQKSLALKAKGSLGKSKIEYPIFPNKDKEEYRSLILRNSGQDWEYSMFRDALQSNLVTDLSDLPIEIEKPDLDDQAYRPVIAYLNGEYWGIYNLRERSDRRYIKNHYGLEEDKIDLLENTTEAKEGDFEAWNQFDSLLRAKTFKDEAGLNELAKLADINHYMDYIIHNVFIDNTDWPGNNFLRWRERSPGGKWRFMTKDLDYGFGFLELNTENFNDGNPNINSLDRMLNPTFFFPNPDWGTLLFNNLIENPIWKAAFINRMADQLNVLFSKQRMLSHIDKFQATYRPEINQQNQKWQNVWTWNKDVAVLRTFATGRTAAVRTHFAESFPEITGTSNVTLKTIPADGGNIKINTVTTNENVMPWTGTYFNGVAIPLQAIANDGFQFVGWSANVKGAEKTTINLEGDTTITAIFIPNDSSEIPLQQSIDFPEIEDRLNTDSSFDVFATASSGLPVTLKIISGPASISGNHVTLNRETGRVLIQASQRGNEQFNAATAIIRFFEVLEEISTIPTDPLQEHCSSKGQKPWHEYIANVRLNTLDNTSFKEQYGDFTRIITPLESGKEYEISLTPGFSYFQWNEAFQVWIDFDGNNIFENEKELVFSGIYPAQAPNSIPSNLTGRFTVPESIQQINTRMRVSMQRDTQANSCAIFELGEVEDYGIQIIHQNNNSRAKYLDFIAFNAGRVIEVQWLTNRVEAIREFIVERSDNGLDFEALRSITPFTSKNKESFFKELDEDPLNGNNYYRLKQNYKDGSIVYSPIQLVRFQVNLKSITPFPNPAKDILYLPLNIFAGKKGTIQLFDTFGRLHKEKKIEFLPFSSVSFPINDMPNGVYYLKIAINNRKAINQKVIINRLY